MDMPARTFRGGPGGHRYGFNGKERDKDMHSLTAYDYGFRIYNPAIGKFLSVDPLMKDYPSWSPYPFAMNSPISGIDLDGLEYLNATESRISIYVSPFIFNSETAISGGVYLDLDNVYKSTKAYIQNGPTVSGALGSCRGLIATYESDNWQDLIEASFKLMTAHIKNPSSEDAEASSLEQQELNIPKNEKKARITKPANQRYDRNKNRNSNKKQENVPSGVATGTAKGNGIMAMVEVATYVIQTMNGNRIGSDYEDGRKQLWAAGNVFNDISFAINTNIINPSMDNISGFSNFLLDGKKPTKIVEEKNKKGEIVAREVTDESTLATWKNIKDAIDKKRSELNSSNRCVPCVEKR